jgi:oligopeptide transport system substrate-binding protein
MLYSVPELYDRFGREIDQLANSMLVTPITINGIERNDMLLLTGGESSNTREYDPATLRSSGDILAFSGLVTFNQQMELVPDLAESWDISNDGLIYTFHLNRNAVFHNGRPVTADDVVFSWDRAADPKTESDTVLTYLGDIVGVKERHDGSVDSIKGLVIVDEHPLQVTIDAPKLYFLLKLTYPTGYIVDRENVRKGKDWYRTPNGTGPYRLIRWDRDELMLYERFESFYGKKPAIKYIVYRLYAGDDMALYEMGTNDIAYVPKYDVERVTDTESLFRDELLSSIDMCTNYIVFDVERPPFDDLKVRQAFSLTFDRERYINGVYSGQAIPAKGIYPPNLPGYNNSLAKQEYDPEKARQLLKESKYAANMPEIVYSTSGYGSTIPAPVGAQIQMWEQELDINVKVINMEPDEYYDRISAGEGGQLSSQGWCADYPDPENFIDVLFHSGAEYNDGHYSNPELDKVLESARTEQNTESRIKLYQQAEQMLLDDLPAIFTIHGISYVLVKPYIHGFILSPISTYPVQRDLWYETVE